jgi:hypothetical protein
MHKLSRYSKLKLMKKKAAGEPDNSAGDWNLTAPVAPV